MKKQKPQVVVVIAAIRKGDLFLLTKRADENPKIHGKWQLPGGRVEFGEHPEEALVREMQEELGISVQIEKLIPHVFHKLDENWHGVFISYLCRTSEEKITLNEEALDFRWVRREDVKKMNTVGPVFELLTKIV